MSSEEAVKIANAHHLSVQSISSWASGDLCPGKSLQLTINDIFSLAHIHMFWVFGMGGPLDPCKLLPPWRRKRRRQISDHPQTRDPQQRT
eukprot:1272070-Amphidinium_carterae.1